MIEGSGDFAASTTAADFLAAWLAKPHLSAKNQAIVDGYYGKFRKLESPRLRYWYNEQLREVERFVQSGTRVLEIGVGTGTECLWFALRGASVVGIDAFQHCVDVSKERLSVLESSIGQKLDCQLKVAPIASFKDDSEFDVIWMEQAFHHLEPRAEVVKRISELLRPGGRVVLSEANALNLLLQAQLIKIRGLKMYVHAATEQGTVIWGNERILWRGALERWLRRYGIEQESARYYRVFPSHPVFERFFEVERRITSQWLAPIFSHYNFVGRRTV